MIQNQHNNIQTSFERMMYSLPCACLIFIKMKLDWPICMDEVYSHWKRFWFEDDGVVKDSKSKITIMGEWKVIQEIFLKAGDNMKLHIKEKMKKISYP